MEKAQHRLDFFDSLRCSFCCSSLGERSDEFVRNRNCLPFSFSQLTNSRTPGSSWLPR